jgi:NAD(P)-dependent dehydrogenase (short-subunit alcohol dehydrogenase family)
VSNAGIAVTAPLLETTGEQWQLTMDVNAKGVLHCYQAAARQMIAQGRGGRLSCRFLRRPTLGISLDNRSSSMAGCGFREALPGHRRS